MGKRSAPLSRSNNPLVDEAGKDVVLVGGKQQLAYGEPHPLRHKACEDVAEIAGRHGEDDVGTPRLGNPEPGKEVIYHLGQDPRPVDGIDRPQGKPFLEGEVVEEGLDDVLAVVEGPFHGHVVDIGIEDGGHLPRLDGGGLQMGMEDEDVDVLLAAHPADCGAAGVAGGCADDVHPLPPFLEEVFEEIPQELQGHVLEGQGRAVKQLQDIDPVLPDHRGDLPVVEGVVGMVDEPSQVIFRNVRGKEGDYPVGQFAVGEGPP